MTTQRNGITKHVLNVQGVYVQKVEICIFVKIVLMFFQRIQGIIIIVCSVFYYFAFHYNLYSFFVCRIKIHIQVANVSGSSTFILFDRVATQELENPHHLNLFEVELS